MPVELERELKRKVAGKKMSKERKDAYVYGTLRKTGWKPEREKNLSATLDNLIEFGPAEDAQRRAKAGTASVLIPGIGATAVGVGTLGAIGITNKPVARHDRPLMQKLNIEAQEAGGRVLESKDPLTPGVAWRNKGTKSFLAKLQMRQVKRITEEWDPPLQGVAISRGVRSALKPGVLAHEIGHLKQPRWMTSTLTGVAGKWGPIGTGIYAGLTGDEKRAKIAAIAGTASAIPLMTREIDASIRGGKLLAKHGVGGIRRLSPGIGLASYAAASAVPAATYAIKKHMGGYKQMSAKLDEIIEFRASKTAKVLGAQIPGVQSRRDPEERLRDRLAIAASIAKTGAGIGLGTAGAVGAYQLHKHGKGLLGSMKKSFEGMALTGPAIEDIRQNMEALKGHAGQVGGVAKDVREILKTDPVVQERVRSWGSRVKGLWRAVQAYAPKRVNLSSADQPIEFERGHQYRKVIAGTFQDMRKINPGNPLTELLARMKINVPAPPRGSEEAKEAAKRLRIMKRSNELSSKEPVKIFESAEEPIQFGFLSGRSPSELAKLPKVDFDPPGIKGLLKRTLYGRTRGELTRPRNPLQEYLAKRKGTSYFDKQFGQQVTGLSSKAKEILFGAEILGPWQGNTGHTSKIDQLEFPADLSPAAALQLPFPLLMQFLNQRNLLQQQYSSSPTMLSARLDRLIEFAASSALGQLVSKLGKFTGSASERVTPVEGYLSKFNAPSQVEKVAGSKPTSALAGLNKVSASRGWGGAGATAPAAPTPYGASIAQKRAAFQAGNTRGQMPGASRGGVQDYFSRGGSSSPGSLNAPVGGTPPPVPPHLAASSAAGVPAAAPPGAAVTQASQATAAANQAGQAAGGHGLQPARGGAEPGWWDKFKSEHGDWSKYSAKKKWAVGGGAAALAGGVGAYAMSPSRQQMSALLDRIITFDNRPRNEVGQFTPQEGGPDPNAIALTYGQHPVASTLGAGIAGGVAGQAGASSFKALLEKVRKAKK